ADHYRWKLRTRQTPVDNVRIAVNAADRLVFHIGGIPCRAVVGGRERWVMVAVDAMTAKDARRQGLLTSQARALFATWKEAGVAMILGMPNENYGTRARVIGWRPFGALEWLLLPLRPERMAARKLGLPWLAELSGLGQAWRAVMVGRRSRGAGIAVEEVR